MRGVKGGRSRDAPRRGEDQVSSRGDRGQRVPFALMGAAIEWRDGLPGPPRSLMNVRWFGEVHPSSHRIENRHADVYIAEDYLGIPDRVIPVRVLNCAEDLQGDSPR